MRPPFLRSFCASPLRFEAWIHVASSYPIVRMEFYTPLQIPFRYFNKIKILNMDRAQAEVS
jgi:hypothetical protein